MNLDPLFSVNPFPCFECHSRERVGVRSADYAQGKQHAPLDGAPIVGPDSACGDVVFLHSRNQPVGRYSPIHLLSPWTLISIGLTVYYARSGNITRHRQFATTFYWLALILTGFFALLPGRTMYEVLLAGG